MKKVLFIDRDGTLIQEPPVDYQVDSLEKLAFVPGAIGAMSRIAALDFELAMVTNQDGLGTDSFPEATFWPAHEKMIQILEGEGIHFTGMHIDPSFEHERSPNRKPGVGMLSKYFTADYNLHDSYVIGDRITDVQLAKNLGTKAILFQPLKAGRKMVKEAGLEDVIGLITTDWNEIYAYLRLGNRRVTIERKTRETDITITLDLDGQRQSHIETGLHFFDHMLEQIVHHAGVSIDLCARGDLQVDEHHTVEDTAIVLGEAIRRALGNKLGLERYGFSLPMDECDATVTLDFGGRIDFIWNVVFCREKIGDVPTEMFRHFFKTLCESAQCNLHIAATGDNEHHKIEGVFKAFARAMKMAIRRDVNNLQLPSSKGML